ncbi:hypothetical protein RM652_04300 [Mammaliicoccus sciuri]|uniref:hypothetical protein n=1 Tax=Mammaliicoccus sciuri TaxID=1296 RepID=UPI00288420E1|nr:hypothetical protein [Mammaliicoccus sciuri]MDT0702326.1 hypothetical protein [Mammaliicoccus sciuri]
MKTWKLISILLFIVTMFILNQSITFATEVINNSEDSTVLSNSKGQPIEINEKIDTITVKNIESNDDKSVIASAENNNPTYTKNPRIVDVEIEGKGDKNKSGISYFDNIKLNITGENLTDDNLLTKEGLHWSDKTYVDIITGKEKGIINHSDTFGGQNTPNVPVKAYSMNNGDKGRINFVGTTKSGINLDLLWTVKNSDKEDWKKNSGYNNDNRVKGLAFTGEQFIPNTNGNSVVTLYNEANKLSLFYQIVKHGTYEENPVLVNFISTDIDAAQGVESNLSNLGEVIPEDSNLKVSNNIIYDATPGVEGLNGSIDLPKGGYLGVGFLSNFDYTFYSPAPMRRNDSYNYAIAVRYDIFGSSLQVKMNTKIKQKYRVNYLNLKGEKILASKTYTGYNNKNYKIPFPKIDKYTKLYYKIDNQNKNDQVINLFYQLKPQIIYNFSDENGNKIRDSLKNTYDKGTEINFNPPNIKGYNKPKIFKSIINKDSTYNFVYVKEKNIKKPTKPSNQLNKTNQNREKNKKTKNTKALPIKNKSIKSKSKKTTYTKTKNSKSKNTISMKQKKSTKNIYKPRNISYIRLPKKLKIPQAYQNYQNKNNAIKRIVSYTKFSEQRNYITNFKKIIKEVHHNKPMSHNNLHKYKKKVKIDWFAINTGLKGKEQIEFIRFLNELAEEANKQYKGNFNEINHYIANGLAYHNYKNNTLQNSVNDLWKIDKSKVKYPKANFEIEIIEGKNKVIKSDNLLHHLHMSKDYEIDLPHMGATIGSVEKSVWYKELIKKIASLPLEKYDGISSKDKFFQLNALTGDLLTHIDKKDKTADIDAMIMYYHPEFKDLPLNERIIKYYSTENLNYKREKLKSEILPIIVKKDIDNKSGYLSVVSIATLGGLILGRKYIYEFIKFTPKFFVEKGKNIIERTKKNIKIVKKNIENKVTRKLKKVKSNIKNYIVKKIVKPIKRKLVSIRRKIKQNVMKLSKRIISPIKRIIKRKINNSRTIKYVARKIKSIRRAFNKRIYTPVRKFVSKRIYTSAKKFVSRRIYTPARKFVFRRIYRPVKTIVNRTRRYSRKITSSISKSKKFIRNGFRKLKRLFRR